MADAMHLPSELTIYGAGQLHADWMARWPADGALAGVPEEIVIGADRVDQVDAAGLQLLLSLRRFVVSRGGVLRLDRPSAILAAACAALGASVLLAPVAGVENAS